MIIFCMCAYLYTIFYCSHNETPDKALIILIFYRDTRFYC